MKENVKRCSCVMGCDVKNEILGHKAMAVPIIITIFANAKVMIIFEMTKGWPNYTGDRLVES